MQARLAVVCALMAVAGCAAPAVEAGRCQVIGQPSTQGNGIVFSQMVVKAGDRGCAIRWVAQANTVGAPGPSLTLARPPDHGSVRIVRNRATAVYQPSPGFVGSDAFDVGGFPSGGGAHVAVSVVE